MSEKPKRLNLTSSLLYDDLLHKTRSPIVKSHLSDLKKTVTGLGYRAFPNVNEVVHWNGRYAILTIVLPDECRTAGCTRSVKLTWRSKDGILERSCLCESCPTDSWITVRDPEGDGSYVAHHQGHFPQRMRLVRPPCVVTPSARAPTVAVNVDDMMTAASAGGLHLARTVFSLHSTETNSPTDVYDGKTWWMWDKVSGLWCRDPSGLHIHMTIVETVTKHYRALQRDNPMDHAISEGVSKLIESVNRYPTREKLVKDCRLTFQDTSFGERLDSDPHLIACSNGVFDILSGDFRYGKPQDYLSKCTNQPYLCIDLKETQEFHDIDRFLRDVSDCPEFIVEVIAQYMNRQHDCTHFLEWIGGGSNGKSKLQALIRMSLGGYAVTIPSTILTGKQVENGRPCPELVRAQSAIVVFFSEPSTNETLQSGPLKLITGGDAMYLRGLFESGSEITFNFLPILCCNEAPNITDQSEGMWRRIKKVPFRRHFVERPDPMKPHQRKVDYDLHKKFPRWAPVLLTHLLNLAHAIKNSTVSVEIPPAVAEETAMYREDSDLYTAFVAERIRKTSVPTDVIQWNKNGDSRGVWNEFTAHVYDTFKHKDNMPNKVTARKRFEEVLGQKLIHLQWKGFVMPTQCKSFV